MTIKSIGSNQVEVTLSSGTRVLVSYETPVACYHAKLGQYLRTDKQHSQTTSRHINKWLSGAEAETRPQAYFDTLI